MLVQRFPKDVQGYASPRTALSKTALIKVNALPTNAKSFPSVFRWRIPHLPSGDSVEFTFHAIDPPWSKRSYVVALYNSERVIVERVEGEPAPARRSDTWKMWVAIFGFLFSSATLLLVTKLLPFGGPAYFESFTVVKEAGCDLRLATTYNRMEEGSNIRVIQHRIFNAGQSCVVKSDQLDPKGLFTIEAGATITRERLAYDRPKLVQTEILVGATSTTLKKTFIPLFAER